MAEGPTSQLGRGDTAGAALAVIDGGRCVHGLVAAASCTRCVAACPRAALSLGEASLTLDTAACDGCGLCLPACPEQAIELEGRPVAALVDVRRGVALAACERSGVREGRGVVPCLDALGLDHLAVLAEAEGVALLVTASGDCGGCARATAATLAQTLARYDAIATSRGRRPLVRQSVSAPEWLVVRAQAKTAHTDVDQGRRRLAVLGDPRSRSPLRRLLQRGSDRPGAIYAHVPAIDAAACTGCDACARACPHGAITLVDETGADETGAVETGAVEAGAASPPGGASYVLAPEACSGCGICVDVCASGAVSVRAFQSAGPRRVPLRRRTCGACRAPYHEPAVATTAADAGTRPTCPVCRSGGPRRRMFEVRD